MIIRDAMMGLSRFDEFLESLGISPTILSRRLKQLVESGILNRSVSANSPVRVTYVLTERGHAFEPILLFLHSFGNKHFLPEGETAVVVNRQTGASTDLCIVDRVSGQKVSWPEFFVEPGPAAKDPIRAKLSYAKRKLG